MKIVLTEQSLAELDERGFTVLPELLSAGEVARFEQDIATLVEAQLNELGLEPLHADPFVDLFAVGGAYTKRFYELLERLLVLQQMSVGIAGSLEEAGFFVRRKIAVPIVWPDIRADIPEDSDRSLPVHQDYRSMRCARAYRLWIPLRPSNAELGSMCVYPETHRLGPVAHNLTDPRKPHISPDLYRGCERIVFDLPSGDAVLLDPLLFHASVPNRSQRTKFTLMIQIQDLAAMIDPRDSGYSVFEAAVSARAAVDGG